ncbi:hypothetical protein L915_09875, partial [Phytophthora nicotianae]
METSSISTNTRSCMTSISSCSRRSYRSLWNPKGQRLRIFSRNAGRFVTANLRRSSRNTLTRGSSTTCWHAWTTSISTGSWSTRPAVSTTASKADIQTGGRK